MRVKFLAQGNNGSAFYDVWKNWSNSPQLAKAHTIGVNNHVWISTNKTNNTPNYFLNHFIFVLFMLKIQFLIRPHRNLYMYVCNDVTHNMTVFIYIKHAPIKWRAWKKKHVWNRSTKMEDRRYI